MRVLGFIHAPGEGGMGKGGSVADKIELKIGDLIPQARQAKATEQEVKSLAKDIEANGQLVPIVVVDGAVYDGLQRIQALKLLKRSTVDAVVVDTLPELALHMADQRAKHPEAYNSSNMYRVFEMNEIASKLKERLLRNRRMFSGAKKAQLQGVGRGMPARLLMSMALGISESRVEILSTGLKLAETDLAVKKWMDAIRNGETTLYAMAGWREIRKKEAQLPQAPVEEIRGVMDRGTRAVAMAVEQMSKFGPATTLTIADRQDLVREIEALRAKLLGLKKTIQRGVNAEVEENK